MPQIASILYNTNAENASGFYSLYRKSDYAGSAWLDKARKLQGHKVALEKLTNAMQEYSSAYDVVKAESNANKVEYEQKLVPLQDSVLEKAKVLQGMIPQEVKYQQQLAQEITNGAKLATETAQGKLGTDMDIMHAMGIPADNGNKRFTPAVSDVTIEPINSGATDNLANGGNTDGGKESYLGAQRVRGVFSGQSVGTESDNGPGTQEDIRTIETDNQETGREAAADRGAKGLVWRGNDGEPGKAATAHRATQGFAGRGNAGGYGKAATAHTGVQRPERRLSASKSGTQDIEAAVKDFNAKNGQKISVSDIQEADNVAPEVQEQLDNLRDVTGRDVFLYASENEKVPFGFTWSGRHYVKDSGLCTVFHAGHEDAHSMPEILKAISSLMKDDSITNDDFMGYVKKRQESITSVRGENPQEDLEQLKTEFACDLFGAAMYTEQTGDETIYKNIGVSNSVADQAARAIKEALACDAEQEYDIDVQMAVNSADGYNQDAVQFSLADVTPQNPTYEQIIKKPDIQVVELVSPAKHDGNKELSERYSDADFLSKPYINRDTGEAIFIPQNFIRKLMSNPGILKTMQIEVLPKIIEEAVFTGRNPLRNNENAKSGLEGTYTFFGAVSEKNRMMPVKLTIKSIDGNKVQIPSNIMSYLERSKEGGRVNKLYDSRILELESIENLGVADVTDEGKIQQSVHVAPRSSISVEKLLNMVVGDARKYIPSSTDNSIIFTENKNIKSVFSENPIARVISFFCN
ncbi:MAG: hypothetical protein RR297_04775 [Clostridia bacterium]